MEAASNEAPGAPPWDKGPEPAPAAESPAGAPGAESPDTFAKRPEVFVGAAFAGGLALAGLLRWLGRE